MINNFKNNETAKKIYIDLKERTKEEIIDICTSQTLAIFKKDKEIERLKELWKLDIEASHEIIYELKEELDKYRYTPKAHFKETMELRKENKKIHSIIKEAREYNEHLIRDAKYHLNDGHLKKMKKILDKVEEEK